MRRLAFFLSCLVCSNAITCYNGLKLVRGGSVGQSTEECSLGASCYNMTASALLLVDVVKAGCSRWRCMLASDRCISTSFQGIPVSLCCCSSDRCNVGENAVGWDPNWNNQGGQGGFGSNGDGVQEQRWGQNTAEPARKGGNNNNNKPSFTREDVEKAFKHDVDTTTQKTFTESGGGGIDEEVFEKVDVRHTTPRPMRHQSGGRGSAGSSGTGSSNDEIII